MLSQQTVQTTYGTTATTIEVTNFLAINVPKYIIEKWQRIVDLAAQITGVGAARLIRVQPPYLKVMVASEGANNPYQQGQQIFFNTGLYSEKVITNDIEENLLTLLIGIVSPFAGYHYFKVGRLHSYQTGSTYPRNLGR